MSRTLTRSRFQQTRQNPTQAVAALKPQLPSCASNLQPECNTSFKPCAIWGSSINLKYKEYQSLKGNLRTLECAHGEDDSAVHDPHDDGNWADTLIGVYWACRYKRSTFSSCCYRFSFLCSWLPPGATSSMQELPQFSPVSKSLQACAKVVKQDMGQGLLWKLPCSQSSKSCGV